MPEAQRQGVEDILVRIKGGEDQVDRLDRMLRDAYSKASSIGKVVGRVSRFSEVKVGENSRITFNIDPFTYYGDSEAPFHRVGDYLVLVDPKDQRLVLVRVTAIGRRDELAMIGVQPPVSPIVDGLEPRGLITDAVVEGELVLELGPQDSTPRPAIKSIEPQAPVVVPRPDVLRSLLDLPSDGVTLGSLATPGGLIAEGKVPFRLPVSALLHHVLVVGTTGSGKTTLLKNMVASAYSQLKGHDRFVAVIVDLNEDFVQLPIPPLKEPEPAAVRESSFSGARPPGGVLVVLPVTAQHLSGGQGRGGVASALLGVVEEYYDGVLRPLTGSEVRFRRGVRDDGLTYFEAQGLDFRFLVAPYVIDTTSSSAESLLALMPGSTELVRATLSSLIRRFEQRHGARPPLEVVLAASFRLYMEMSSGRSRSGGPERKEFEERLTIMTYDLVSKYVVPGGREEALYPPEGRAANLLTMELVLPPSGQLRGRDEVSAGTFNEAIEEVKGHLSSMLPHRETVRALFSRVSSLLDAGFVDVLYSSGKELRVMPEPSWSSIVGLAGHLDVPVVVDLRWGIETSQGGAQSFRVLAYRLLDRLLTWKHRLWSERASSRSPNVVVFIDEAHQFFPSEGRTREEAEEVGEISAIVSKVARLGRARGIGLVFSTHIPRDLNNVVVQLTNTKVILRSEESQLDVLSLPGQVRQYAPRLQDRYMAVVSYALREGYVFAVTTTPLTMHYDLSAGQPASSPQP
ncbi:MAG: helicase HerA domain-containing protein [Acidilobus sp.]